MPTFQPPLSTSSSVFTQPPKPHFIVRFDATFESNEDQSGTWEIWTDTPVLSKDGTPRYGPGEWHAITFEKSASPLTLHVEVLTPANVGSSWAYTYRRVFPDGNIHWLGGPGSNGEIKVEQGEDLAPAVLEEPKNEEIVEEQTKVDAPQIEAEDVVEEEEMTSATDTVKETGKSETQEEVVREAPNLKEAATVLIPEATQQAPSSDATESVPEPVLQICPAAPLDKVPAQDEEVVSKAIGDKPSVPSSPVETAHVESEEEAASSDITDSSAAQSSTEAPQTVSHSRPGQSQDLITFFSIFKAFGDFLSNIWSWFFSTARTKVQRARYEGEVDDLDESETPAFSESASSPGSTSPTTPSLPSKTFDNLPSLDQLTQMIQGEDNAKPTSKL